jgi:threonyl-tRNA synthetase
MLPNEIHALPDHDSLLPPQDHRALAARLDLCHFQDEAPAMAFWHPRGWTLYRLLEEAARDHVVRGGYREVRTPQLIRRAVWERSGHWGTFHDGMFACGEGDDQAALKPVSSPGHIQLVRRQAPSWRDLPIRVAEFGLVHRDEPAGSVHGLMRLRQFTQDDGHIFCSAEQAPGEIERFCRDVLAFYRDFGFDDVAVALSLRPANRLGDDAAWDRAEQVLADAIGRLGIQPIVQPGAGAIYGPQLELLLPDHRGRRWQCGTIQLDFVMPERFDVRHVAPDGERRPVVMLHRALFGSLERFMAILLERHEGALPAWLAPEQVAVLPIADAQLPRARELCDTLVARGIRARLAAEGETLKRRIAIAHHAGIPFSVVIGAREVADGTVAVRGRDAQWSSRADEAIEQLVARFRRPT